MQQVWVVNKERAKGAKIELDKVAAITRQAAKKTENIVLKGAQVA
jgi:hypothetical protein